MITYDTLIKEIEKHILLLKSTKNTQQIRENLSAIRALCDVGLAHNMVEITENNTTIAEPSSKMDEDDGRSTSIFDF